MSEEKLSMSDEEIKLALGRLLWGKDGGKFSMGKLIRALIFKRLTGR